MSYSPEGINPEVPHLSSVMKKAGAWALAGVLVAGGAAITVAYNDLRQGVDGPVFDIHHAETHALDTQQDYPNADPANVTFDAPLFTVELS